MENDDKFWDDLDNLVADAIDNGVCTGRIRQTCEYMAESMQAIQCSEMPRHKRFTDIIAKREREQAA